MKKRMPLILLCLLALLIPGCDKLTRQQKAVDNSNVIEEIGTIDTSYKIYYLAADKMSIDGVSYNYQAATPQALIEECIRMLGTQPESEEDIATLEAGVKITGFEYDEDRKKVDIEFNGTYDKLPKNEEILVRAAVVKTLTQFDGVVDYVQFSIDGEPLTESNGRVMVMMNSDFVENTKADIKYLDELNFSLYFASSDGTQLVANEVYVHYYQTASAERVLIESLISGPLTETLNSTMSSDTKLNDVYIENRICYVDFNSIFLEKYNEQNFAIKVYSVVNSLIHLDNVDGVVILINGQPSDYEEDGISLKETFSENKEIVMKPVDTPPVIDNEKESESD